MLHDQVTDHVRHADLPVTVLSLAFGLGFDRCAKLGGQLYY